MVIVSAFRITVAVGQIARNSNASRQPAGMAITGGILPTVAEPSLPACPAQGIAMMQPSASKPGHHQVTLSWKASAPSAKPEAKAAGYCLYRSKSPATLMKYLKKQSRKCKYCELVNPTAFSGTTCVDDLVRDGATYYYAATAVNAKGTPSPPSNVTLARIPNSKTSASSSSGPPYPACRTTTSSR